MRDRVFQVVLAGAKSLIRRSTGRANVIVFLRDVSAQRLAVKAYRVRSDTPQGVLQPIIQMRHRAGRPLLKMLYRAQCLGS